MQETITLFLKPIAANWTIPFFVPFQIFEREIRSRTRIVRVLVLTYLTDIVALKMRWIVTEKCCVIDCDVRSVVLYFSVTSVQASFRCERHRQTAYVNTFLNLRKSVAVYFVCRCNIPCSLVPVDISISILKLSSE